MSDQKTRRLYICDNLDVLRNLPNESVNAWITDPPFNKNRVFRAADDTSSKGQYLRDIYKWTDLKNEWLGHLVNEHPLAGSLIQSAAAGKAGTAPFLVAMGVRLIEMKRTLAKGGAILIHCDNTASHWLTAMMDIIFGATMFQNNLIWRRTKGKTATNRWPRTYDNILFYRKRGGKMVFYPEYLDAKEEYIATAYRHDDGDGLGPYRHHELVAPDKNATTSAKGRLAWKNRTPAGGRRWNVPGNTKKGMGKFIVDNGLVPGWPDAYPTLKDKLDALDAHGLVYWPKNGEGMPCLKRYLRSTGGQGGEQQGDIILEPGKLEANDNEYTGWATQKPQELYEKFVKAVTNKGDTVGDPFAGCGTTLGAAEALERNWIGIDIDPVAEKETLKRMDDASNGVPTEFVQAAGNGSLVEVTHGSPPPRQKEEARPSKKHRRVKRPDGVKEYVYGKFRGICHLCDEHVGYHECVLEHVEPLAVDGEDKVSNLAIAHGWCNSVKGTRTRDEARKRIAKLKEERRARNAQISMEAIESTYEDA